MTSTEYFDTYEVCFLLSIRSDQLFRNLYYFSLQFWGALRSTAGALQLLLEPLFIVHSQQPPLRCVTFTCLRLCKGPYTWARRNTLTRTPMSCMARKLTRFNLVSWKLLSPLIGSFVYDYPRRQEHKQNTAIGRTWLVRLTICTIITSQILLALAIDIMWFLKK